MARRSSDHVPLQVHRLFNVGTVGSMSDAELLDSFASQRDEVAEAAFEAIVIRHGPMVFGVCRSVLHDRHDAEDAFQAVFLVLANRAGTIRRSGALASWLFGVALRVADRVKRSAARRRALHHRIAQQPIEGQVAPASDPNWEILHQEIDCLPARLRAPIVLCYLEGRSYDAAATQLGLSNTVIRGRLARARERLRNCLTRRGVTIPAGLATAGFATQCQAEVPQPLLHSSVRIALGFTSDHAAVAVARGVLGSMLLNKLKVAAVVLCLGIASSYWAWHAYAASADEKGQSNPAQGAGRESVLASRLQAGASTVPYQLTGSVRLDGTGEPVAGATVNVMIGDSGAAHRGANRTAKSGADGQFTVDLPPGSARAWTLLAPVGYWVPANNKNIEEFAVSKDHPIHRKDYVVRRGTVWEFRIKQDGKDGPLKGAVIALGQAMSFRSVVDDEGRVRLTLPMEGGKVTANAMENLTTTDSVQMTLEWETGFQPDTVKAVTFPKGSPMKALLHDRSGKTATLLATGRGALDFRVEGTQLITHVTLPKPTLQSVGNLSGKVIDPSGNPIADALVALIWVEERGGSGMAGDEHTVVTDAQGIFQIRSVPRSRPDGKPVLVKLTVTKAGFAGVDTETIRFQPAGADGIQLTDTVTLAAGVSLSGTVVDPDGKPLAGAWVEPGGSYASRSRFTKTDDSGRFTVSDLPAGVTRLSFHYGKFMENGTYFAAPGTKPVSVKLRPTPNPTEFQARADAAKAARALRARLTVGTPAPDWDAGAWSDGRSRTLADYRGKVVLLNFWGLWCGPCIHELPTLEKLRSKYEPLGVEFLTLHTPGETDTNVRALLALKKCSLVFAIDRGRQNDEFDINGVTAERYGVGGYPTTVIIDRTGKIAFLSNDPGNMPALQRIVKELGLDPQTVNQEQASRYIERFLDQAIDRVVNARDSKE